MLPPLANRRKPSRVQLATLIALLLQFAALAFAMWHGHREVQSLEVRDAAIEKIVEHVDAEVDAAAHASPREGPTK